jgi:hypothetical protein
MTDTTRRRLAAGLATIALLLAACGDQSPRPSGSAQAPAPSGLDLPTPQGVLLPGLAAAPFPLRAERASDLWGLYRVAGMTVNVGEHAAAVQATVSCTALIEILTAGEWSVGATAELPLASPRVEGGAEIHWLVLERGEQAVFAQLGGNGDTCGGKLFRSTRQMIEAHGAVEASGEAMLGQQSCMVGGGKALTSLLYFGPGDYFGSLDLSILIRLGEVPVEDLTLTATRSTRQWRDLVEDIRRQSASGSMEDVQRDLGQEYWEGEAYEGSVTVTSLDPLVGEVRLEGLTDGQGATQSFRGGFRCDLPPGQLAAAAEEAATATPRPTATARPASELRLEVAGGPKAGTYTATKEVSCSRGLMRPEEWLVTHSPGGGAADGEVSFLHLTVSAPSDGGRSTEPRLSVFIGTGMENHLEIAPGDTRGSGTATITRAGSGAAVEVSGRTADGTGVELSVTCGAVDEF